MLPALEREDHKIRYTHLELVYSVVDGLIERFQLCVPLVYGSVLFPAFRPALDHSVSNQ